MSGTQGSDQVKPPIQGQIHALAVSTTASAAQQITALNQYTTLICDVDIYIKFHHDNTLSAPAPDATDADPDGTPADGNDNRAIFWPANTPLALWVTSWTAFFRVAGASSGTLRWWNS